MFFSILIQFNLISDFCFFCSKGRPRPCPFLVYNCHYKILCKFRFLSLLHHHFFCNSRLLFLLHQREAHTLPFFFFQILIQFSLLSDFYLSHTKVRHRPWPTSFLSIIIKCSLTFDIFSPYTKGRTGPRSFLYHSIIIQFSLLSEFGFLLDRIEARNLAEFYFI